jgi:hypothetical protein
LSIEVSVSIDLRVMVMSALAILRGGIEIEPLRNTTVATAAEGIAANSGGFEAVAALGAKVEHG